VSNYYDWDILRVLQPLGVDQIVQIAMAEVAAGWEVSGSQRRPPDAGRRGSVINFGHVKLAAPCFPAITCDNRIIFRNEANAVAGGQ
jgi:hypothetical protein